MIPWRVRLSVSLSVGDADECSYFFARWHHFDADVTRLLYSHLLVFLPPTNIADVLVKSAQSGSLRPVLGFLPPDAVRWRDICYGDVAVCLSVCLFLCLSR